MVLFTEPYPISNNHVGSPGNGDGGEIKLKLCRLRALELSHCSQSSNFYNVGVAAQYFGYYHYDYDYEAAQILDTVIKIIF